METIADILLIAGSLGAAAYCMVLSRRLARLRELDSGMGGAIAVLSAQVDEMTKALDTARKTAGESATTLSALTERSEQSARRLELMLAALHDLPDPGDAARLRVMRRRRPPVAAEAALTTEAVQ